MLERRELSKGEDITGQGCVSVTKEHTSLAVLYTPTTTTDKCRVHSVTS
jgi:hypothetical protein